jgi:hypothetical protein
MPLATTKHFKFVGGYEAAFECVPLPGRPGYGVRGSSHEKAGTGVRQVGEHIQGFILVVAAVEQFSGTDS